MAAPITRTPQMTIAATPPLAPLEGDLWWSTTEGQQYVWYDDGNTIQWVITNWGMTGPKGAPGQDGAPGEPGPPGEQGPPGTGNGVVETIVPGDGIDVDNTDPANPIVGLDPGAGILVAPPGCAVLTSGVAPPMVSPPLVSRQAYALRNAIQTQLLLPYTLIVSDPVMEGPFKPLAIGSSFVTANLTAHGRVVGDIVAFSGITTAGAGIAVLNATNYSITGVTANTFTFDTGGANSALNVVEFGGNGYTLPANPQALFDGGATTKYMTYRAVITPTLREGPFKPVAIGSSQVFVNRTQHNRQVGDPVTFTGIRTAGSGIEVLNNTQYTVISTTAAGFTIDTGPPNAALNLVEFGGNDGTQSRVRAYFVTWSIRLQQKPNPMPAALEVRIEGWHGKTTGEHPAAGLWETTRGMSDYYVELLGSTYVPDSMYLEGHCYVPGATHDAASLLNPLLSAARALGAPTVLQLPPGLMLIQDEVLRVPEGMTFRGYGMRVSQFFLADRANQKGPANLNEVALAHMLETGGGNDADIYPRNIGGVEISDVGFHGNRARQIYQRGTHALALGGLNNQYGEDILLTDNQLALRRVLIAGSAGYGWAMQGESIKRNCTFEDVIVRGCDNDGCDFKNGSDGNNEFQFTRVKVYYWAMKQMGTNLQPIVTLPPDRIITTAGSTRFSMPRKAVVSPPQGPVNPGAWEGLPLAGAGQTATLITAAGQPTSFDGINLNDSFHIVAMGGDEIIMESPTPAIAGGTGGGIGIRVFLPSWAGDVPLDIRSLNTRLDFCYAEGWMTNHGGFRQRGGAPGTPNGQGGDGVVMNGCKIKDTSPAWQKDLIVSSTGFTFMGQNAQLINPIYEGNGGGRAIYVGPTANGIQIVAPDIKNVRYGATLAGKRAQWEGGTVEDASYGGIVVHGGVLGDISLLGDNPLHCPTIGTNVVIVWDPGHPLSTGSAIEFIGHVNANGVVIDPYNTPGNYPVTVIDANQYSIIADGSATSTDAFGGDNITIYYPADPNNQAEDIHLSDIVFRHKDPNNTSTALILGQDLNAADNGQANDVTVVDCHNRGYKTAIVDYGSNIQWGPGNSGGIPNLPNPSINSPVWLPVKEVIIPPGSVVRYVDVQTLFYPNIRVELMAVTRGGGNTALEVSDDNCRTTRSTAFDTIKGGDASGSAGVVVMGSSGAGLLVAGESELYNFYSKYRTEITVSGGLEGSGTGPLDGVAFQQGARSRIAFYDVAAPVVGDVVTQITVGGVNLMVTPVAVQTTAQATVDLIVAEINLHTAATRIVASRSSTHSNTLIVREYSTGPEYLYGWSVGLPVAVTATGLFRRPLIQDPKIVSTKWNSLRLNSANNFNQATIRVYQRGG